MRSPRHRWNVVAPTVPGLERIADGLSVPPALDAIATDLQAFLRGRRHKNKLLGRAYRVYQSDSGRMLFDSMLLATGDVAQAAEIVRESADLVQTYADCFFDIAVFEGPADKIAYLDRVAVADPQAAQIMRNTMAMSVEGLRFLSDKSKTVKITPKEALEQGLTLYATLFHVFLAPRLETLMRADRQDREEFDWTMKHANTCSSKMLQFSHELLHFELDKTAENFLEEFVMKLLKKDDRELIADRAQSGDLELY